MKTNKFIILMFPSFVLFLVLFILFLSAVSQNDKMLYEKPFFCKVDEILYDGENLYAYDGTFKNVYKYNQEGEFVYGIHIKTKFRIFLGNDALCIYDTSNSKVYRLDENGNVLNEFDYENYVKNENINNPSYFNSRYGDETCHLKRLVINKKAVFSNGTSFYIENTLGGIIYLFLKLLMVISAVCFGIGVLFIIIKTYKR